MFISVHFSSFHTLSHTFTHIHTLSVFGLRYVVSSIHHSLFPLFWKLLFLSLTSVPHRKVLRWNTWLLGHYQVPCFISHCALQGNLQSCRKPLRGKMRPRVSRTDGWNPEWVRKKRRDGMFEMEETVGEDGWSWGIFALENSPQPTPRGFIRSDSRIGLRFLIRLWVTDLMPNCFESSRSTNKVVDIDTGVEITACRGKNIREVSVTPFHFI